MADRRVDPEDGTAYTWEEVLKHYTGKYKKKEIEQYWETMQPAKSKRSKAKAKAKGEAQAEPAAEPKAKTKAKDKAKAKAAAAEDQPEAEPKAKPKAKAKAKAKAAAKREPKPAGNFKVTIAGASGGIGQPLSLLMAMDPNVKELAVFDLDIAAVPPAGVAADLGHLERKCTVKGYTLEKDKRPTEYLQEALTGSHLVLVPAGMPRKPGQTRDDLFKVNADIAKGIVEATAKYCPEAVVGIIVNPVNSVVPAMAELYKKKGLDPLKIVGITTLDVVRANKFVGEIAGKNPNFVNVPVVGGHAGATILPLFSQDKVAKTIPEEKIPDLDKHVQDAGTDVVNAKNGKGSATLSMAYAGARLGKSVLAGLSGRKRTECAFVASNVTDLPYFAQKVVLGETGVVKVLPLGDLSEYEAKRLEEVKEQLKGEVESGLQYAEANSLAE